MSSRLIYICAVILLVGIQEIRAQQRDTIVIHDTVYVDKAELEQVHAEKDIVEDNTRTDSNQTDRTLRPWYHQLSFYSEEKMDGRFDFLLC